MATETTTQTRRERLPLNGVDTPTLFATLDVVKDQPALAKFQFRAGNRWMSGTHSRDTIGRSTAPAASTRTRRPSRSTPTIRPSSSARTARPCRSSSLLHALAACLTAGIANIAAARGVTLTEVESPSRATSTCAASSACPRRSATATRASAPASRSKATRPPRSCGEIVEQSRARSAVFDVLTNGVPVSISVNAG